MVRLANESIVSLEESETLKALVAAATTSIDEDDVSDVESEDESCALNISCHGAQFRQMIQEDKCDLQIVRKRKLQTHLASLDSELSHLCFTSLNSTHKSTSDDNDADISPRTAKIIKRSIEHSTPYSYLTRKENNIASTIKL